MYALLEEATDDVLVIAEVPVLVLSAEQGKAIFDVSTNFIDDDVLFNVYCITGYDAV